MKLIQNHTFNYLSGYILSHNYYSYPQVPLLTQVGVVCQPQRDETLTLVALFEYPLSLILVPQVHHFFQHDETFHQIMSLGHKWPGAIGTIVRFAQGSVDVAPIVHDFHFRPQHGYGGRHEGIEGLSTAVHLLAGGGSSIHVGLISTDRRFVTAIIPACQVNAVIVVSVLWNCRWWCWSRNGVLTLVTQNLLS